MKHNQKNKTQNKFLKFLMLAIGIIIIVGSVIVFLFGINYLFIPLPNGFVKSKEFIPMAIGISELVLSTCFFIFGLY